MVLIKKFLLNKKFFILLLVLASISVGFVNGFEHILNAKFLATEGKNYFPFLSGEHRDVIYGIGTRIRDVLDGHLIVSDRNIYEYIDFPAIWPPLSPLFFLPFKIFTNSIIDVLVITSFIFPLMFCLLFFILYYCLSGKKWLSLFFATLTSLYPFWSIHLPPPNLTLLKTLWNTIYPLTSSPEAHLISTHGWESFIPPLILFLLCSILVHLSFIKNKKYLAILTGLVYALNAYAYPYHFIYLSATLGVLCIFFILKMDKKALKQILIIFFSGLFFLIPFFINQIEIRNLPQYWDVFSRYGVEVGRNFRWEHWQRYLWNIFLSIIILVWGARNNKKITSYFIASFLLSIILALNMQVVLGFSVQTDHWASRDTLWGLNFAYFVLIWWAVDYLKKKYKLSKIFLPILAIALLVSLFANTIHFSIVKAKENYRYYTLPQNILDAYNWLNKNTPVDSVIMTPSLTNNYLIPYYTHNRIYLPSAYGSVAPEEEAIERLYIVYKFFEVDEKYLDRVLNPDLVNIIEEGVDKKSLEAYETKGIMYLFSDKYIVKGLYAHTKNDTKNFESQLPRENYEKIISNYKNFECSHCLEKYRIDYLFYGPNEKKITKIDLTKNKFLNKIYYNNEVEIYKININE